jgi:hypothetical protein
MTVSIENVCIVKATGSPAAESDSPYATVGLVLNKRTPNEPS